MPTLFKLKKYKKYKFPLCYIIILMIMMILVYLFSKNNKTSFPNQSPIPWTTTTFVPLKPEFPMIIYQTIKDKKTVPPKVYEKIWKYAPEYKHVIFDDDECIQFIKKYYSQKHVDRFHNLQSGPHKADLFRYCILYKKGGIYLDIKTELIQPLHTIFTDRTKLYSVIQFDRIGIYQGVLASPPGHPIFLELIDYILTTDPSHYLEYTQDFYKRIHKYPQEDMVLFNEECNLDEKFCNGLDRYGLCCNVFHHGKRIIKTRYNDYPW